MIPSSSWLLSGLILVGITAVLGLVYIWVFPRARPMTHWEARVAIKNGLVSAVVDVRTPEEYEAGHYPRAIHIPLNDLPRELPHRIPDRKTAILFYCQSGSTAATAARWAQDLGYADVYYLSNASYPNLEPQYTMLNV
jgi:rhodanese-related sulfurtransferase